MDQDLHRRCHHHPRHHHPHHYHPPHPHHHLQVMEQECSTTQQQQCSSVPQQQCSTSYVTECSGSTGGSTRFLRNRFIFLARWWRVGRMGPGKFKQLRWIWRRRTRSPQGKEDHWSPEEPDWRHLWREQERRWRQ